MSGETAGFDKRTLRQRCTTYVRDQIIAGQMSPGEHIIETKLADELGVSRGTLREALRPLEIEGLLVSDGRGHMLVRETTTDEIRDVFEVRAALEELAAAKLATRDDCVASAEALKLALAPLRDDSLDFAGQLEIDLGFHELLCALTGNATLLKSWRHLIGQIEMMIIAAGPQLASGRMRYDEHVIIADAIRSGDADRAKLIVKGHMAEFASKYLGDRDADIAIAS